MEYSDWLMVADHYNCVLPLREIMKLWSNREAKLRLAWIKRNWNKPSRSDHYLMSIAAEVRRVLHKHPNTVKLDDLKIKFKYDDNLLDFVEPTPASHSDRSDSDLLSEKAERRKNMIVGGIAGKQGSDLVTFKTITPEELREVQRETEARSKKPVWIPKL